MPRISIYKKEKNHKLKLKAYKLYRQGHNLRAVALAVNRSHEWVRKAVKESSISVTVDKI